MQSVRCRLDEELQRVQRLGGGKLWEALGPVVCAGKKIRPRLVCDLFLARSATESIPNELIGDVVALELIHSSTLIHDDIIDGSTFRRGVPTLNSRYGDHVALLLGNLIKDHALDIAATPTRPILNAASRDVNLGQLWETQAREHDSITLFDTLQISLFKAARIFRHAVRVLSNYVTPPLKPATEIAFELVAIAYQAVDDWLDFAELQADTRKQGGMDEANNVHSFMRARWSIVPSGVLPPAFNGCREAHRIAMACVSVIDAALNEEQCLAEIPLTDSQLMLRTLCREIRNKGWEQVAGEPAVRRVFDRAMDRIERTLCPTRTDRAAHFDELALKYESLRPPEESIIQMFGEVLALSPNSNQTVIDIGCGVGTDLEQLRLQYGVRPFGIDVSRTMAAAAREKLGVDCVACADGLEFLEGTERRYHAAILKFSAHHFSDLPLLFRRIGKSLILGGKVAVVTMMADQVEDWSLPSYFPSLRAGMLAAARIHQQIPAMLSNAGFVDIQVENVEIATLKWDESLPRKVRSRFISFLNSVPEREFHEGLGRLVGDVRDVPPPRHVSPNGSVIHARVRRPHGEQE